VLLLLLLTILNTLKLSWLVNINLILFVVILRRRLEVKRSSKKMGRKGEEARKAKHERKKIRVRRRVCVGIPSTGGSKNIRVFSQNTSSLPIERRTAFQPSEEERRDHDEVGVVAIYFHLH
jgi:beta-lactamase regulating signal transducer with metallopeptidase domain